MGSRAESDLNVCEHASADLPSEQIIEGLAPFATSLNRRSVAECNHTANFAYCSFFPVLHHSKDVSYKADHVFHWASQCADAIEYIHWKGFAHTDIKPAKYTFVQIMD